MFQLMRTFKWAVIFIITASFTTLKLTNYHNYWLSSATHCGSIIKKPNKMGGSYKHTYQINMFIIQFDNVKRLILKKPSDVDYYTYEVGDRICYDLTERDISGAKGNSDPENKYVLGLMGLIMLWIITIAVVIECGIKYRKQTLKDEK